MTWFYTETESPHIQQVYEKEQMIQAFCHSLMFTGVMISGPSFFPDLLVQGLKKG